MSSEAHICKEYSPLGVKPDVRSSEKRFSVSMISSITNQGKLRYMMYKGGLRVDTFIEFLRRLTKSTDKPFFIILDNLRVHHGKLVHEWVEKQNGSIQLFFLPSYSPEYNPDEYLNQDLKVSLSKKK